MARTDENLTAPEKLALVKLFSKDEADLIRDGVAQGEFIINTTVNIRGVLKVGKDYMAKNHQRLNPLQLIALLLDGMPKQVRDARVREAVARLARGEAPDTSDLKATTDAAVEELMTATEALARGKTSFAGAIEIVEVEATA